MSARARENLSGRLEATDGGRTEGDSSAPLDVRTFTVGLVQENAYIVRAGAESKRAVMVDPGDEPQRLLDAASALGVQIEAILITHCHFDHIGAVAPVAKATGAPVYCPEIELGVLADIMKWTMPGFGPFESWEAEHTVGGGERLDLAGLDIEVLITPGHSPGHVTYAIAPGPARFSPAADERAPAGVDERAGTGVGTSGDAASSPWAPALFSGDVLFAGSVGRVDLPGGDWGVLERSIAGLLDRFAPETVLHPGHMGATTLGRERDTNPFLSELRVSAASATPPGAATS